MPFFLYQKTSDMDLSTVEKKKKELKELKEEIRQQKEKIKELQEKLRQLEGRMKRRKVLRRKLAGIIRLIAKPQQYCNEK